MSTFRPTESDYVHGTEYTDHWCPDCGARIVPKNPNNRGEHWRHVSPTTAVSRFCEYIVNEADKPPFECIPSPCFFVEFLVAWDIRTWSTVIEELPPCFMHEKATNDDLVDWANQVLSRQPRYDGAVMFAVFNINPYGIYAVFKRKVKVD